VEVSSARGRADGAIRSAVDRFARREDCALAYTETRSAPVAYWWPMILAADIRRSIVRVKGRRRVQIRELRPEESSLRDPGAPR